MKRLRVALAGNPNTGKSTIFNALTGSRQHVGNWPGKTIAKKEGYFQENDLEIALVDLPGAYSLSAYSPDEEVTRDYIVLEKPDLVVNVVDATNLERNLYLTAQIVETGVPVIIALNMKDMADRNGCRINHEKMAQLLGAAVIPMAASKGQGIELLRQAIVQEGLFCGGSFISDEDIERARRSAKTYHCHHI